MLFVLKPFTIHRLEGFKACWRSSWSEKTENAIQDTIMDTKKLPT